MCTCSCDCTVRIGTNGIPFKVGDRITISGFFKWPEWPDLQNGAYTIARIGGDGNGANAFHLVPNRNTDTWYAGSRSGPIAGATRITSSSGAEFYLPNGFNKLYPSLSIGFVGKPLISVCDHRLLPMDSSGKLTNIFTDCRPDIVLDDPVTPTNPPTTPTTPTPPTPTTPNTPTTPVVPPPLVKRNGTTVSVPFLSSASFKPGTDARANERGKAAFIKAVQAASKASNLNKAQSDQLMADVIKAIKDADLKRRKITPLKGKK